MNFPYSLQVSNEQVLSQQFHQMSPFKQIGHNAPRAEAASSSTRHRMDFDTVPDYLGQTNPLFATHMQTILPPANSLETFREVAILMHKMMTINIVHALWLVYRTSGIGALPSPLSSYRGDRNVWPTEVQSLADQRIDPSVDKNDAYLRFVEECLNDLSEQNQQCQRDLRTKTQDLRGYTRTIEHALETFVRQGLQTLKIDMDWQISFVRYHYIDELMRRAYLAENPNDHQVSLVYLVSHLHRFLFLESSHEAPLQAQTRRRNNEARSQPAEREANSTCWHAPIHGLAHWSVTVAR